MNDNTKKIIAIAITALMSINAGSIRSEEANKTTAKSGFLDVDSSRFPAAITAELVNGTIEYVNGKSKARISLKWDLIPLDNTLKKHSEDYSVGSVSCQIANEDLGEPGNWFQRLSEECKQIFIEAKIVDSQGKIQERADSCEPNSPDLFQKFWRCQDGDGYKVVKSSIPSSQYFGLLRDRTQLSGLLKTKGIDYSLKVTPGEGDEFDVKDNKKIVWDINTYKFLASKSVSYYRFVVTASIAPNDIYLPVGVKSAKLNARIKLKKDSSTIGIRDRILGILDEESLPITSPKSVTLNPINDASADRELNRTLSLFGSPNLGEVVTNNFLGGSRDASLFYGGMIAKNSLEPIVGANLGLADIGDGKLGVSIGIGTNSSNTPFYIGPSLQYSIFTLSGGVRLATNSGSIDTNVAGIFSLDLSQLLGGKREVKEITVNSSATGGNWGKASDLIYEDIVLIDYKLTDKQGTPVAQSILLTQEGCGGKSSVSTNASIELAKPGLQFIPRGKYKYNTPPGSEWKTTSDSEFDTCTNNKNVREFYLKIEKK